MNNDPVRLDKALKTIDDEGGCDAIRSKYSVMLAQRDPQKRRCLLEEGALIPGGGRTPALYRPASLVKAMARIAGLRAADELARMEAAA